MSLMLLQTTTTEENSQVLMKDALKSGLVSCIQKVPIESYYYWENTLKQDKEILLTFKVNQSDFEKLRVLIEAKHIYEIPEIVGMPLDYISSKYQRWHNETIKTLKDKF
ncbi:divalent cation tolerance protein CutA [Helicobacter canadensis]|uniref:Divalent cation tolerance protein n=1 Tax=Helicobacter canadensis MIT 98-5491 TaxID=537970 RepID=C5ZXU7_9HELI|nr:divalent-cation tolerance protein CutA [Helicobacter canadensis]EES89965.1 putative divalent cation tolerance protein [Helicobacter canadensis MIT 98-5491]EFR49112.1 divalent cation tolerance protein, CutA1 family [Helicobacter canadensis MIT 98-5491]STP02536.1 divalent cation tolerance protein [Helicobacter canadensis]